MTGSGGNEERANTLAPIRERLAWLGITGWLRRCNCIFAAEFIVAVTRRETLNTLIVD